MSDDFEALLAPVRTGIDPEDCLFYHRMEIPGLGEVGDEWWDLRGHEAEYLGNVDFAGKRVLEIGPASGYLTCHMEQQGASVLAVDLPVDAPWNTVPHASLDVQAVARDSAIMSRKFQNAWWLVRERFGLRARAYYGDSTSLPAELGHFDVAVLAAVLLHCRDFLGVLEAAASIADVVVVTDVHYPELDTLDMAALAPTVENQEYQVWWAISPHIVIRFLRIMGFTIEPPGIRLHSQVLLGAAGMTDPKHYMYFTVVAHKEATAPMRSEQEPPSDDQSRAPHGEELTE